MLADIDRLRLYIADRIPDGGTDDEAFFSDLILDDVLERQGDVYAAASECWAIKQAYYADMVDLSDTTMSRAYSDLHRHASEMVVYYTAIAPSTASGSRRATVSSIVRPPATVVGVSEFSADLGHGIPWWSTTGVPWWSM
jgi:hypothetical protein